MPICTINPTSGIVEQSFESISQTELNAKITLAQSQCKVWSKTTIDKRAQLMMNFADILKTNRHDLARLITLEMGCPISQAETEIEKCAFIATMFANHTQDYLSPEKADVGAKNAFVSFEPLGTLLHIAPWNYPFYLALRPVIPALMAGNTVLMKHASNVPQIALRLETLFLESGFEPGVFQTLLIDSSQIEEVINHPTVKVITLIGSEKAGMAVASSAGKAIKKTIMELGGNDPMIVFADADLDKVIEGVIASRIRNCGQSCNAAKRYIIHKDIENRFIDGVRIKLESLKIGNPFEPDTDLGPVATTKGRDEIIDQIEQTVAKGAKLVYGGTVIERNGNYITPAIISGVLPGMACFDNEVFGPVVSVSTFETVEGAIDLANNSKYGLGASIWTADETLAYSLIPQLEAGNVYVNGIVRGDPKMPFGGVKLSGYGREFGEYGIKEFVNIKSVVVK